MNVSKSRAFKTHTRSRRNTSEGLRRKPSGKGRGTSQQQKSEALAAAEDADDPRRPSVEDLALTENLIPGGKQIYGDEDEDEAPAEYSVKKLSELDPRFVSAPGGSGSTTATASGAAACGIGSDTESLYGIPYR